jgi:uncharacterized protein
MIGSRRDCLKAVDNGLIQDRLYMLRGEYPGFGDEPMGKDKKSGNLPSEKPAAMLILPGEPPFPVYQADTFFKRFLGLMGRRETAYGLYLKPCDSIHMFFMRFPIDAVFTDKAGRIMSIHRNLKPGQFALGGKGSAAVLELPSSRRLGVKMTVGMMLPIEMPE